MNSARLLINLVNFTMIQKTSEAEDSTIFLMLDLEFFYDMCDKVDITPDMYSTVYSIVLRDKAQGFKYQHLARRNFNFDKMISKTRSYFHTPEKLPNLYCGVACEGHVNGQLILRALCLKLSVFSMTIYLYSRTITYTAGKLGANVPLFNPVRYDPYTNI